MRVLPFIHPINDGKTEQQCFFLMQDTADMWSFRFEETEGLFKSFLNPRVPLLHLHCTPSYSVLAIKSLIYSWSRLPEHTVITTFCADQEKKIL